QTLRSVRLRETYNRRNLNKKTTGKSDVKELDAETGLYYYGARYLDPRTSRWLSGDPAMGEYVPLAPINDEARKHNSNLPGLGGVFNYVNLHVYHYAGNNPIRYIDPDGRSDEDIQTIREIDVRINELGTRPFRRISDAMQRNMDDMDIRIVEFVGNGPPPANSQRRSSNEEDVKRFANIPEFTVIAKERRYSYTEPVQGRPGRLEARRITGTEFSVFLNGNLVLRYHDINNDSWIDFVEFIHRR
ncbi:MAG: RHS repeat-associated core domain-containing protein, partial [Treponema sp.]|nr:RHS repeat-associated core domain-containing protein [Treponema sp.]